MELDSVLKVGPNVFELEILPKSKGLKNGRTSLKTMPREPQKKKLGGGVIKCQKPRHEVLLQMKSHNHPALISSHLCVSITMLIFLSNTGGYGQTIFFFFFLLKQFSGSCYLHP